MDNSILSTGARKVRIQELAKSLDGLANDARYHDLRRTFGDHSIAVLDHLESCARIQRAGQNHT